MLGENESKAKRGFKMIEERSDYFLLAYDSPNFSAAAAKVPMTPQGFTKIIKHLERDLGVPLFVTNENGVRVPTSYADEYYQYAKHMQVARQQLVRTFDRISSNSKIDLNVGCSLGIPGFFGAEAIQKYSIKHPDVNVVFDELPDALCDRLVHEGYFNVGLTLQPVAEGLNAVDLISSHMMLWVNVDDPLSFKESLTFEDIVDRKIAMPGRNFRNFLKFTKGCEERGVIVPEIVEYSEIFWIYHFVLLGKGLGFTLPHLASLDFFSKSENIVAIPFEGVKWQVCFSWSGDRLLTAHEKGYLESIKREAAKLKRKLDREKCARGDQAQA